MRGNPCRPGDLAVVILPDDGDHAVDMIGIVGEFTKIKAQQIIPGISDLVWLLDEPIHGHAKVTMLAPTEIGQRVLYAGDCVYVKVMPDKYLQPIRGVPAPKKAETSDRLSSVLTRVLEKA